MPGAVYSRIGGRLRTMDPADVYPLHVGDTWMEPLESARMEALRVAEHPGMHRYTSTHGLPALVDGIVEKARARNGLPAERAGVLITAGATGGLGAAVGMMAAPGDEVLILAPFWPLIRGIVQAFRATPVEVPFFGPVGSADDAVAAVEAKRTARTVALYVSTPSNPTGRVIPPAWLAALADWARANDLWLLSDETYEDYAYRDHPHASIGACAPERTITAFSFSKAYGMAGNRTGYLVGPADAMGHARKISTHTFYSAPTAGQLAGLRALRDGQAWIDRAHDLYRDAGDAVADILGIERPQGSTFFFLDVAHRLDERGIWGFLEDCAAEGLFLAPGPSFGQDYPTHTRICFTSAPPDRVIEAARRLKARLG